ncbi:MAG: hypothetical protein JXB39_08915 [Deltaproteobacteria bacterium]|nr:hypothetical protein [Deltaproteobacteria bacterium]
MRRLLPPLATTLVCVGAAVILSWPLATDPAGSVRETVLSPDASVGRWLPGHLAARIRAGQNPFQAPDLYWPDGFDLCGGLHNLGVDLLLVPLYLVFAPVLAYNVGSLLIALANAAAGWRLGRTLGQGRPEAAAASALVLGCSAFAWYEAMAGRHAQAFLAPMTLTLLGLWEITRGRSSGRTAVATGVALAVTGYCYWFYAAFIGLVAVPLALVATLPPRRQRWLTLAGTLVVALVLATPGVVPLLAAAASPDSIVRRGIEAGAGPFRADFSLHLTGLFWPAAWWDGPSARLPFVVEALVLSGLVLGALRRRAGFLPWLAGIAVILALGEHAGWYAHSPVEIRGHRVPLPLALGVRLPLLERFWWPSRLLALTWVGAAGVAAVAVSHPSRPRKRWLLAASIVSLVVLEGTLLLRQRDVPSQDRLLSRVEVPAFFEELGREPGRWPLLQLPFWTVNNCATFWVTWHRQPLDGGPGCQRTAFVPAATLRRVEADPVLSALRRLHEPDGEPPPGLDVAAGLRRLGYRYVLLWREPVIDGPLLTRRVVSLLGEPMHIEEAPFEVWDLETSLTASNPDARGRSAAGR